MVSFRKNADRYPKLTHHRASGQGVVRLNGRDVYCGPYGTPECRTRYLRAVAEWEEAGRGRPDGASAEPPAHPPAGESDLTINEVMLAYQQFADDYYRKNGEPTSEAGNIRLAIRPLRQRYGDLMAKDFGPLHLKAVREAMMGGDLCRNEINRRVRLIVRAFKWAVSEGMVPPSVHHGLKTVEGLNRGRCKARESRPVRSIADACVDPVKPFVSRQIWAMIEMQRLTGMRPGEACIMRTMDINTAGTIWEYRPESHKTEHHGKERVIFIGPRAQDVLKPWLRPDLTAYLFSPREAVEEHWAAMRVVRKSKVPPSQVRRRKSQPRRLRRSGRDPDGPVRLLRPADPPLQRRGTGWLLGAVATCRAAFYLRCLEAPCARASDRWIWRCGCSGHHVENLGDRCHACLRPRHLAVPYDRVECPDCGLARWLDDRLGIGSGRCLQCTGGPTYHRSPPLGRGSPWLHHLIAIRARSPL